MRDQGLSLGPTSNVGEHLLQEDIPRNASRKGKVLMLLSLSIGVLLALFVVFPGLRHEEQGKTHNPAVSMPFEREMNVDTGKIEIEDDDGNVMPTPYPLSIHHVPSHVRKAADEFFEQDDPWGLNRVDNESSIINEPTKDLSKESEFMCHYIDIPENVSVLYDQWVDDRVFLKRNFTVTGPKGRLTKKWLHFNFEAHVLDCIDGEKKMRVDHWSVRNRKEKARLKTVASEMTNMLIGVTQGFAVAMKACYNHFPISVYLDETGKNIIVKNLLGEKNLQKVHKPQSVTFWADPKVKDLYVLSGIDKEEVTHVCSRLQELRNRIVSRKDHRKFLDGIYRQGWWIEGRAVN